MILYFSGTKNSAYVAKRIGEAIDDEVVDLFEKIRNRDFSELGSERPWVIVTPTYAWRIPRILQSWLESTCLMGSKDIYFVMTCGENIANAGGYLQKYCGGKGMNYRGCIGITMPENYIALFATPTQAQALQTIERAEGVIDDAARLIKNGDSLPQAHITFGDRMSSGIVNSIFYPMFVHARRFYVTDACIACGKCVGGCPLSNIRLNNGRPEWGNSCTHCMACICRCPKEAVEYGKRSKGKPRYSCPK